MEPPSNASTETAFEPRESSLRGLRNTILLRILVVSLLPLIVLSWYFRQQYTDALEANVHTVLRTLSKSQAEAIDRFITNKVATLDSLATTGLLSLPWSEQETGGLLSLLQDVDPSYLDLGVFDAGGDQIRYAGPYPFLEGRNYAREPWFQALASGNTGSYVSDVYRGYRDQPHFIVAVRVVIGATPWYLRVTIHPTRFSELVNDVNVVAGAHAFIVNENGIIQSAPKSVGAMLTPAPSVPPVSGIGPVVETRDGAQRYLVSSVEMKSVPWTLVVRQDLDVAFASVRTTERIVLVIFVLGALVIVGISIWATQGLVRRYRRAERDRGRLLEQLVQAGKMSTLGEMAAGVAHEINNPLAVILSEVGLMTDDLDPAFSGAFDEAAFRERLASVRHEVYRCKGITHKLLGFARQNEPHMGRTSVDEMIEDAVALVRQELALENIEIDTDLDDGLPPIVTDAEKVRQVLLNLLRNAADAIGKDGRITVLGLNDADSVAIQVRDTGPGIPDEHLQRIFQPFFTTKEVGRGTGLGLSISHGIITSLGGRIEVYSRPGEGATFKVVLPKRPVAAAV